MVYKNKNLVRQTALARYTSTPAKESGADKRIVRQGVHTVIILHTIKPDRE